MSHAATPLPEPQLGGNAGPEEEMAVDPNAPHAPEVSWEQFIGNFIERQPEGSARTNAERTRDIINSAVTQLRYEIALGNYNSQHHLEHQVGLLNRRIDYRKSAIDELKHELEVCRSALSDAETAFANMQGRIK